MGGGAIDGSAGCAGAGFGCRCGSGCGAGGWHRRWVVFRLVLVMVSLVVQMVGGGKGDSYPGVVVAFGRRSCFRWCS